MNDLAVSEREEVGERTLNLDPGVKALHPNLMHGYELVTRTHDPVQLYNHRFERRQPPLRRSEHTVAAVVGLSDVVGKRGVLVFHRGVEDRHVRQARHPPLPQPLEILDVLLRHGPPSIPHRGRVESTHLTSRRTAE